MKRVFAHIGFSMAITLFALNVFSVKILPYALPLLVVIFIGSLLFKKTRQALAFPLCFGTAIFACLLFLLSFNSNYLPQADLNYKSAECEFQIIDLPEKTDSGYAYTIKTTKIKSNNAPQNIKLRFKTENLIDAEAYDYLSGYLTFYSISDSPLGSYGYFANNIFLTSKSYSEISVKKNDIKPVNYHLLNVRSYIKDVLSNCLLGDYGGVALAILIGDRSNISADTLNAFSFSGASHVMAISGLNTTFLGTLLYFVLKKLRVPELPRFIFVAIILFCYSFLAGFSNSVIRSSIMLIIMLFANLIKKHSDPLNSLGLAVFIIFLNPFAVSDVGTIMSVLATLAVVVMTKPLYFYLLEKIPKGKYSKIIVSKILDGLVIAFSVAFVNLPVSYLFFGYLSVSGLFANLFVVPLGTALMFITSLIVISSKLKYVCYFFTFIGGFLSKCLIFVVKFFAETPFAKFCLNDTFFALLISGLIFLFAITILFNNKKAYKIFAILTVMIITLTSTFNYFAYKDTIKVKVLETGSAVSAIIYDNKNCIVVGAGKSASFEIKNFLNSSNCNLALLLLPLNSKEYTESAEKIVETKNVLNLVMPTKNSKLKQNTSVENYFVKNEFETEIWNGVKVKYNYYNNESFDLIITSFNKTIKLSAGENRNSEDNNFYNILITNVENKGSLAEFVVYCSNKQYNGSTKRLEHNEETTIDGALEFIIKSNCEISARRCFHWAELAK